MASRSACASMGRFLILFAVLLAACGSGVDESLPGDDETATRPARTATALPAEGATLLPTGPATAAAVAATLSGTVVSASDVGSQPDTPLPDQLVLLLPAAQAPDLLGVSTLTEEALRFLGATVDQAPPALSALRTGPDGEFSLTVAAGIYVLCLADNEGVTPTAPPYQTRGCAPLTMEAGETLSVEVSTMFGEIVVTPIP